MKASFFSLAQAKYASGEFKHTVFDSVDQVRGGAQQRAAHGPALQCACPQISAPAALRRQARPPPPTATTLPGPASSPTHTRAPGHLSREGAAGQRGGREAAQV